MTSVFKKNNLVSDLLDLINDKDLQNILYWAVFIILIFCQIIYTFNSTGQLRYEETGESIRAIYWLKHGYIYNGVASNIGWYLPLLILNNLFGYSMFMGKFFRLFLAFLTLLSLALLLKKYLNTKNALIPFITIGLSPTLLYFTSLQAQFGIDLQFLPICLYILSTINFKRLTETLTKQGLFWVIVMIAWLSYPAFVVFIPAFGYLFVNKLFRWKNNFNFKTKIILCLTSLISFLTPLLAILLVKNKALFLYDATNGKGLFRGGGNLDFNLDHILRNFIGLLRDLFYQGQSYNFELSHPDFSNLLPIISLILILITIFIMFKNKIHKNIILLCFVIAGLSLLISSFTSDLSYLPGIRRNTSILAVIYIFFIFVWNFVQNHKWNKHWQKNIAITILLILPLHHIFIYQSNLNNLIRPSAFRVGAWFSLKNTPNQSINFLLNNLQKEDLKLSCFNEKKEPIYCRYPEIYATLASFCEWKNLKCNNILGFDDKTGKYLSLNINLWLDNYWPQ